jgi:hypothetical protein
MKPGTSTVPQLGDAATSSIIVRHKFVMFGIFGIAKLGFVTD